MMQDASNPIVADPDRLREIKSTIQRGDVDGAIRLARTALEAGQRHPLLFNLRALWLEREGRDEEALADLALAVSLAPEDPIVRNAYGLCLEKHDRLEEALAAYRAATDLNAGFAPAFFNLGRALEGAGELIAAEAAFERVAALDPRSAEPLGRLAMIASRRGDWPRARAYTLRTLAIDPNQPLAKRAMIAADMEARDYPGAEAKIDTLLADPRLGPFERRLAYGLRADLRHAQHRYPDAFAAYAESNRCAQVADGGKVAKGRTGLDAARWTEAYFSTASRWEPVGPPPIRTPEEPVIHAFLMGFPRSGTTLLEQVLASHPSVVSLEEKETLVDSALLFMTGTSGLDRLRRLGHGQRDELRQAYWNRVRAHGIEPSEKALIDKLPFNALKLPIITRLFPEAKILFALRDPRDVVLSCFRQQFRVAPYTIDLLDTERGATFYAAYMSAAMLCLEKLPLDVHFTRHEDLVDDFDRRTRAICDFIGLDWSADMRDFTQGPHLQTHAIATPSALQVAKGLNRSGFGTWRRYKDQMAAALPILRPWVERFGYSEE